jgi:hypothetical protein
LPDDLSKIRDGFSGVNLHVPVNGMNCKLNMRRAHGGKHWEQIVSPVFIERTTVSPEASITALKFNQYIYY